MTDAADDSERPRFGVRVANVLRPHRARLAEERLAARERENAQLRRSAARVVRI